jgi:hypothetical protein
MVSRIQHPKMNNQEIRLLRVKTLLWVSKLALSCKKRKGNLAPVCNRKETH